MDNGKRMCGSYEIRQSLRFGDTEVVLGADMTNSVAPFMVADCNAESNALFYHEQFDNAIGGDDYLDIAGEFLDRAKANLEAQIETRFTSQILNSEHCLPAAGVDLEGKIIIINPARLRPDVCNAANQLHIAKSGFGCKPSGGKVFCDNLYTGDAATWRRSDVLGLANPDKLPDWAAAKMAKLEHNRQEKNKGRDAR